MMKIEATTTIDYAAYRKFFLFSFLQGRRSRWQAPLLLALTPIMTIVFLVLYIQNPADTINLIGFVMLFAMCLLLTGIILFMPHRYYLSIEDYLMTPNHYRFDEDSFSVWTDKDEDIPAEYAYDKIEKAYVTNDAFYINLGPGQVCIIGHQAFTSGAPDDLQQHLLEKIGDRLIVRRKAAATS